MGDWRKDWEREIFECKAVMGTDEQFAWAQCISEADKYITDLETKLDLLMDHIEDWGLAHNPAFVAAMTKLVGIDWEEVAENAKQVPTLLEKK